MNLLQALVLGAIQGLTEFLPISSTAHLRVIPALLGWSDPGAAYSAIIQLGTTIAVLVYFAGDILRIARAFLSALAKRRPFETADARMGWYVILGTVPVAAAGLLLKKYIEHDARSLHVIAWAAIALALLLTAAEKWASRSRHLDQVTTADGIWVGLAQTLALVPGASRSGVTLTAGLFRGLTREAAAHFSFLLSIPATTAAGLFELRDAFPHGAPAGGLSAGPLIVGTLAALVLGYLSIAGLLRFLKTRTTYAFVVYRLLFGAGILALLALDVLKAS